MGENKRKMRWGYILCRLTVPLQRWCWWCRLLFPTMQTHWNFIIGSLLQMTPLLNKGEGMWCCSPHSCAGDDTREGEREVMRTTKDNTTTSPLPCAQRGGICNRLPMMEITKDDLHCQHPQQPSRHPLGTPLSTQLTYGPALLWVCS